MSASPRPWLTGLALSLALLQPLGASAKEAAPLAQNPAVEARLQHLGKELRCLVCQNETITDSTADLAQDLRQEIRELIIQGKTDQEIKDYLVARYGDFVLYRPPVQNNTLLLWFGPALFFLVGLGVLVRYLRRRTRLTEAAARSLSPEERARAESLLKDQQP